VYCSEKCQKADFHQHSADCHDIDEVCLDSLRSELENHPDPIAEEILKHFDNDDFHAIQAGICLVGWKAPKIGRGRKKSVMRKAATRQRKKGGRKLFKTMKGRKRRKPLVSTKTKAKAAAAAGGAALLFG
jgi:hypothetical protein